MPQTQSAKRAVRQTQKRAARNLLLKARVKRAIKTVRGGVTNLGSAYSIVDRAAKNNLIHWRRAARLKSRLARLVGKRAKTVKKSTAKTRFSKKPQPQKKS